MEGMIGEIRWFAGNFAPRNWAFCNGQTIAISSNTALFSILGTTYGGNGTTNFQLPNFQSRVAVGAGTGPGLSTYNLGQIGGVENTTMTMNNMPAHVHAGSLVLPCSDSDAVNADPNGLNFNLASANVYGPVATTSALKPFTETTGSAGSGQPFEIIQPYNSMYFIICQYGIFPARN